MSVKIDKRLNLVFPLGDGGTALQVHSEPISRAVFEKYWAVLTRTFGFALQSAGLNANRIASLALKETAERMGVWEDEKDAKGTVINAGVKNGLLAEIRRRTNAIVYSEGKGWETLPYEVVAQQGKLDEDEQAEVESAIVFFTLGSWVPTKRELPDFYESGLGISGARTTSSNCTEWARSLKTSTATETSTPKAVSSVPS